MKHENAPKTGTIFTIQGARLAFGTKVVLRGVDLELDRSEVLGLVGASGSGKSLLLKAMIGLQTLDKGTVTFDGQEVTKMNERELLSVRTRVGMVFQYGALFESMSIGENVGYGLYEHQHDKMSKEQIESRIHWALESVALPGIEHLKPSELSGGMRKRAAVARTIALRPEVLLYDEPTMGLDPVNTTRIGNLIAGLHDKLGICSVVVTHDMRLASEICDRIALLEDGRIVAVGTPDEMHAHPNEKVRAFVKVHGAEDMDEEDMFDFGEEELGA